MVCFVPIPRRHHCTVAVHLDSMIMHPTAWMHESEPGLHLSKSRFAGEVSTGPSQTGALAHGKAATEPDASQPEIINWSRQGCRRLVKYVMAWLPLNLVFYSTENRTHAYNPRTTGCSCVKVKRDAVHLRYSLLSQRNHCPENTIAK